MDITAKDGIYLGNSSNNLDLDNLGRDYDHVKKEANISADTINIKATGSTGTAIQNIGDFSRTINLSKILL